MSFACLYLLPNSHLLTGTSGLKNVSMGDMNAEFWNNRANGQCYQYYIWHPCKGLKKEVM